MNLYNNEDEKKGGAPVMPTGGAPFKKTSLFGKSPMISRAAGGMMDRLKNLSRKDMAFVGMGLSVLVTAPVAEYMMSKPSADGLLAPGFGSREGSAISSLYEPGINALSQGSADGSGEVITPLSARDPASLILGSQPAQAPVMAPPPDMSMRDAMKDSGRAAFSAAAKSAGAPTMIPRMQAAMRGLSFISGDGGSRTAGGLSGKAIIDDAQSASAKAAKRSMVGPVAMPGYKGVASNTPNSGNKSALEKLRSQADKSAGNFTGGGAMGALDRAAADAVFAGRGDGGAGAGGEGEKGKSPSNSTNKNSHSGSYDCRTLECKAAEQRQQKALDWEFFVQYDIKKQIVQAALTGLTGSLTKAIGGFADNLLGVGGGGPPEFVCLGQKVIGVDTSVPPVTKDCDYTSAGPKPLANTYVKIRSSDEKTTGGWTSGSATADKLCPCGAMPTSEYLAIMGETPPGAGSGNNSNTPGGQTAEDITGAATTAAKTTFETYDATLVQMLESARSGANTGNSEKLLKETRSLAGGFYNLKLVEIVTGITSGADTALNSGGVAVYESSILETEQTVQRKETEYTEFVGKLDAVIAASKIPCPNPACLYIKPKDGAIAVINEPIKAELAQNKITIDQKKGLITEVKAKVGLHKQRLASYKAHLGFVATGANSVNDDYTAVLGTVQTITEELKNLPDKPVTLADITLVRKHFLTLSGLISEVSLPTAGTVLDPKALALNPAGITDFRDAAAPNNTLIFNALTWRGIPSQQSGKNAKEILKAAYKDGAANDADAIKTEVAAWQAATPLNKNPVPAANAASLAPKSLLAESIRGARVPVEANSAKLNPGADATALNPIATTMESIKTRLTAMGIDMDKPTGGTVTDGPVTTPVVTPPVVVDPSLTSTFIAERTKAVTSAKETQAKAAGIKTETAALNDKFQALQAKPGKETDMLNYKELGKLYSGKIAESEAKISALVAEMEACTDSACVTAKKDAIATEMGKLEEAKAKFDQAYKDAQAISTSGTPPVDSIDTLRSQAKKAYTKLEAAYKKGDTAMAGFLVDTPARLAKQKEAAEKMKTLKDLKTAGDTQYATSKNSTVWATVNDARKGLVKKAADAEPLATAIAKLRKEADALPGEVAAKPQRAIDHIHLLRGTIKVPAYDKEGKRIEAKECKEWGANGWGLIPGASVFGQYPYECKKWHVVPAFVKVHDYSLSYDKGERLPMYAKTTYGDEVIQTADGRVHYNTEHPKVDRLEYEMEVILSCKKVNNKWVVDEAALVKGMAESADELGGGVEAGWNLGVDISAKVEYSHTWNHFRHGEPVLQNWLIGKPCK